MSSKRLRPYEDVFVGFQRAADVIIIVLAHGVASHLYHQPWRRDMGNATLVAIVVFSVVAELLGVYRHRYSEHYSVEARSVLGSWVIAMGVLALYLFATKTSTQLSRVISFGWFFGSAFGLFAWRVGGRLILRTMWASGRNLRRVAIVGATPSAEHLCEQIRERPWLGQTVVGIYDDRSMNRRHTFVETPCRQAGGTKELLEACRAGKVDVVYIAVPLRAEQRIAQLVRELANTTATVHLLADFLSFDLLSARWSAIGDSPLISIHETPFRGVSLWLKRLEDILAGIAILMLIAVPLLVIGLLVKLTSPGPAIFRQRRYGLNGREIKILKFRTMTVCEDGPSIVQAQKNDARVTRLGSFLRRTSLDELPQFLQVITGDMSIVGPRPHAVAHNEEYRAMIPGYMLRHKVKPGITGWAQVNGWRGETPTLRWMKKRVEHDLEYINSWTLLWDLKIILLTVVGRKKNRNAF